MLNVQQSAIYDPLFCETKQNDIFLHANSIYHEVCFKWNTVLFF
jgi:hypothetical protein